MVALKARGIAGQGQHLHLPQGPKEVLPLQQLAGRKADGSPVGLKDIVNALRAGL